MSLLLQSEEMVLLAVWKLNGEAYCVPIRTHLKAKTGKDWSFGSIFNALDRLEKKGLLRSTLTAPTKVRGGRSRRVYRVTVDGKRALAEIYRIQSAMWDGASIPDADIEEA
jgi:PadR family transcriptional regulator PadR